MFISSFKVNFTCLCVGMDNNDPQNRKLLLFQQLCVQYREYLKNEVEFWDLVACAIGYIRLYVLKHIYKEPCMTSFLIGERWIDELLNGHEKKCFNTFRMNQNTFRQLCLDLENKYGLRSSSGISILEKVGLFVYLLSRGAPNRDIQERFNHSGESMSRIFKEVLNAMGGLSKDILVPNDHEFKEISPQIVNDARYMPHFKVIEYIVHSTLLFLLSESDYNVMFIISY